MTLISYIAGPALVKAFMDIPEIIDIGALCVKISLIAGPISGLQQLATKFFQATKRPTVALVLSLTRDGLIYLPLLYLFNHIWGFYGFLSARPAGTPPVRVDQHDNAGQAFPKERNKSINHNSNQYCIKISI